MSFTYELTRRLQLYGEWRNITSDPETYYIGNGARPAESKFNGSTYGLGLRLHF